MKIHSIVFPVLACLMMSCGGREQKQEPLSARRMSDSIKAEWLRPHEALLRVHLDAEEVTDIITDISVSLGVGNSSVATSRVDRMMTHPFERDFTFGPCEGQTDVEVRVTVNDTLHASYRTIVPHLLEGTRTQINLNLSYEGHLRLMSSWIDEFSGSAEEEPGSPDTVRIGHYLASDGRVTEGFCETSVALVIETDGRHGKAVGLSDVSGEWVFSSNGASTGLLFETIDGKTDEGLLDRRCTEADSLHFLFYSSRLPYPSDCAFGCADGYSLCRSLLRASRDSELHENNMLNLFLADDGSYIPSVAEMAMFYNLYSGYEADSIRVSHLVPPYGVYLTSSESSVGTFYTMDFKHGALTGRTSKRYMPLHVRLFYLF